jgi:hypothetical protein
MKEGSEDEVVMNGDKKIDFIFGISSSRLWRWMSRGVGISVGNGVELMFLALFMA